MRHNRDEEMAIDTYANELAAAQGVRPYLKWLWYHRKTIIATLAVVLFMCFSLQGVFIEQTRLRNGYIDYITEKRAGGCRKPFGHKVIQFGFGQPMMKLTHDDGNKFNCTDAFDAVIDPLNITNNALNTEISKDTIDARGVGDMILPFDVPLVNAEFIYFKVPSNDDNPLMLSNNSITKSYETEITPANVIDSPVGFVAVPYKGTSDPDKNELLLKKLTSKALNTMSPKEGTSNSIKSNIVLDIVASNTVDFVPVSDKNDAVITETVPDKVTKAVGNDIASTIVTSDAVSETISTSLIYNIITKDTEKGKASSEGNNAQTKNDKDINGGTAPVTKALNMDTNMTVIVVQ